MRPAVAPRLSPLAAGTLTFLAAGCVLVLEIAAVRLLAPYVGVTLATYTGIIGVILAGIALGAWVGGRAADRFGPERLLGPAFVTGGLASMAAVPIVTVVGGQAPGTGAAAIVLLAGLGFVAPATLLSAVAPMIVRATLTDLETSGSLVGRLSAIGTVGAISGTFLTGFVLLGLVPTRWLIAGVGAFLVVVGIALTWRLAPSRPGSVVAVVLLAITGLTVADLPGRCDRESAYYCITVVHDPGNASGRTLVLDQLRHAYVDVDDPSLLEFRYIRWFDAAAEDVLGERDSDTSTLHLGGGGFSFPRHLERLRPASRHTVLELDLEVVRTAREQLGFDPTDRTTVITGDARLSIGGLPDNAFHLVVGDAFGGLSVPWHLTTVEFIRQVDRVLLPGGRYVLNLIDGGPLAFVRAQAATLRSQFAFLAVMATRTTLDGGGLANVVLVASHVPIDGPALAAAATRRGDRQTVVLSGDAALRGFIGNAPVLRDDFAPVDQLLGR